MKNVRLIISARTKMDLSLGVLLFVGGFAVGVSYLLQGYSTFFYQTHMPSTVMHACGWGWTTPESFVKPMWDFLWIKVSSFDCADIPQDIVTTPHAVREHPWFYYREIVGRLWSAFGITQQSLWPMLGFAHGAYGALAYGLLRLFFAPLVALVGAALLVVSSGAVTMLGLFRDYSKGPFFLAEFILIILLFRSTRGLTICGLALVGGAVVGVGSGFRPDVLILIPFFILSILRISSVRDAAIRITAVVGFLLTLLVTASPNYFDKNDEYKPILRGAQGFHGMQGLSQPFTAVLGLESPFYDVGHAYLDELTNSMIVGFYTRTPSGPIIGTGPYSARVGEVAVPGQSYSALNYYFNEVLRFPADIVVRSLASTVRVMNYFRMLDHDEVVRDPGWPGWHGYPVGHVTARWHEAGIVKFLNWTKVSNLGVLFFLGFSYYIFRRDPKEALFVSALILWMTAIPAFQFSYRHVYHLEFLYWAGAFATIILISDVLRKRPTNGNWRLYVKSVVAFSLIFAVTLVVARWRQHVNVEQTVFAHFDAQKEELQLEPLSNDEQTFFTVPVPKRQNAVLARPSDDQTFDNMVYRRLGMAQVIEVGLETYAASFGGANCDSSSVAVKLSYAHGADSWQALDRTVALPMPSTPGGRAWIIFPAFYRASQHFEGIELATDSAPCLKSFARITDDRFDQRPLFLFLRDDWEQRNHYQTFQRANGNG